MWLENKQLNATVEEKNQYILGLVVSEAAYNIAVDVGAARERIFVLPDLGAEQNGTAVIDWVCEALSEFYKDSKFGLIIEDCNGRKLRGGSSA